MISFPNAKINLGLHITGKRQDGFHNLETLFYPVQWCDALEIVQSEKKAAITMEVKGAEIGRMEDNLCYKAWELISRKYQLPPVELYLQKGIPHGAGLGGGSSDAAQVLLMLNEMFHLKISQADLAEMAAVLGSDCAFFIYNQPMLATGRGEILSPYHFSLKNYYILIVMPDVAVSTKEAYSLITPKQPDLPLNSILLLPVQQWKYALLNDFEEPVFAKYPSIKKVKEQLYELGAVYASMSGSGAAVFGIFDEEPLVNSVFPGLRTRLIKM